MRRMRPSLLPAFHVMPLDAREQRLVWALREAPAGPLRDRAVDLAERLLHFAAAPGCPEAQADGVPCLGALAECDRCERVLAVLDRLDGALRAT
jgi:hypothetical protein